MMKKITIGILAHVDAGKTTLSEGMLYLGGAIKKLGRVDHQDAFLDHDQLEKERGITVFSKQANFTFGDTQFTLLDTPGHVDFSTEMERTLQVLDYAILVINGMDGIQGHTLTLWHLLERYQIPTFLFINKMDLTGSHRETRMEELKHLLHSGCIDFSQENNTQLWDEIALCDDVLMEQYLEAGTIPKEALITAIHERSIFPCFFGSALKMEGIKELCQGLDEYTSSPIYPQEFGALVYKIARDPHGTRLTYLKVTGGTLKVKTPLTNRMPNDSKDSTLLEEDLWEEKIDQIRIYSGEKYQTMEEVSAGSICAVTGLTKTFPGENLGIQPPSPSPVLEPVLTFQVLLPQEYDIHTALQNFRQLEEEDPQLHVVWDTQLQELHVQLMGEIQLEILKELIARRFGVSVQFGPGNIIYKETIANPTEGVGHFEPLRHYAEVHLLLEPGSPGSGLQFATQCSEDFLAKSWQHLILTHLKEKQHIGVLTGSPITDMKITLLTGRAHLKHTEGGDFRQATYRAVRQGLMKATSVLLEPWYQFRLDLPSATVGRAMADIQRMYGTFEPPLTQGDFSTLIGTAPVATMRDYSLEVTSYTKGKGRLFCSLKGYYPCHNSEEVITQVAYDPQRDLENTPDSVFCDHGAGFPVKWNEVDQYMHLPAYKFPQGS